MLFQDLFNSKTRSSSLSFRRLLTLVEVTGLVSVLVGKEWGDLGTLAELKMITHAVPQISRW